MKPKIQIKLAVILLMLGSISFSSLQAQSVNFSLRDSVTVQGNIHIISNAIVGLSGVQDQGNPFFAGDMTNYNPNNPYNGGSYNDGLEFGYIDIDSDASTFSSSSAEFIFPLDPNNPTNPNNGDCAEVAFAGLYWSATYYVDRDTNGNPLLTGLPLPDPRPDYRSIKFRPPGAANYIDIVPGPLPENTEVIFDGYRNTPTNPNDTATNDIPYVCFADVTDIVSGLADPRGIYTVGNVRSTIGDTELGAGASAGWVLVVVYEDPSLSAKKFSIQDGYLEIDGANPETFTYGDFETLPAPNDVRARYGVATLEGDFGITGDGLSITNTFGFQSPLFADPVNPTNNFFNSSISVDGNFNTARNPNSENTLGFDADIFDIANGGNFIIGNNQNSVDFTATTSGDRYRIFLNLFSIEVIEPVLKVKKRVLDINGIDITGGGVSLADQLFYELEIENQGNEDVINASIRDILPANIDFRTGTITVSDPGITVTYLPGPRELDIQIDPTIIERGDGPITVRFGVDVVASCADLRDACSNEIRNIAISQYEGAISGEIRNGEESVLSQDVCQFDIEGASNFLIDLGSCDGNFEAFLCTGTLDLTAGGGFPTYVWTDLSTGTIVGNSQTLTVSSGGQYRVDKSGNPDCNDLFEIWTVTAFNTITNPIIPIASDPNVNGNIRTCPITGDPLPELFLCGATDSIYLDSGFVDANTIVWERLDPAACPAVPRDPNCPTLDGGCAADWTQVATTRDYTVSDAGEYRITATFDGNCTITFYFNVFKNNFEPNLVIVRDIVCSTPGTLRVQNSSNQYEYQLVTPSGGTIGYQASPEFTGLTEGGTYTVNVRQNNGLPTACVFNATQFMDVLDSTVSISTTSPGCPGDTGEVQIQVTNGDANYTYNISSTTTAFTATEGPTTDPNHTFTGLNADTYDVEILSYDGECIDTQQVVISPPLAFSAVSTLTRDLSCNPGYQPDPTLNDPTDPNFDPTAPPFDPDQFIALVEVNVTGGIGGFIYGTNSTMTPPLLTPEPSTSNIFRFTAAGTYTIFVQDTSTGCIIPAGSVVVSPYEELQATATGTDPVCPGADGSILVQISAGEGPFTYVLDGTTSVGPLNQNNYTFNNVPVGAHTITITDRFGCELDPPIDVTLTASNIITADIAITQEYRCDASGSSVTPQLGEITISNPQNGNGSYEYSIDGVDFTNTTGIFTGLTDGTYTLYIRDTDTAACPVNLGQLTIDPLQEVTDLSFSTTAVQCPAVESTITVSATGSNGASSFEYRITAPAGSATAFSTNDTYTLAVGTYTFEARTTTDGCIYSEDFTINNIDFIAVTGSATSEPTCNGD
ncbi:hypothetical protein U0D62_06975, partial [Aquimarina sp. 2201CG5-10]|nr:hypothetical protein [Aquimarina sp. 2201CG5-10]